MFDDQCNRLVEAIAAVVTTSRTQEPGTTADVDIVQAHVQLYNTGRALPYAPSDFSYVTSDGARYKPVSSTAALPDGMTPLSVGTASVAHPADGFVEFEVPHTAGAVEYSAEVGGSPVTWSVGVTPAPAEQK